MPLTRNSSALAPLRGKDALDDWISLFGRNDPERAERYSYALSLFMGDASSAEDSDWGAYVGRKSPRTIRAYRYAIAEFFEFLARYQEKIVPPHRVTRKDTFTYVEWLSRRGEGVWNFSLEAEKLKDGDRVEDLAVYETLQKLKSAKLSEIARALPYRIRQEHPAADEQVTQGLVDEMWLEGRLKRLMSESVISRSPTMVELRREFPRAGRDEFVNPDVYTYTCVSVRPVARSTIHLRLSALSEFWNVMQQGENVDEGRKALLEYNVFDEALRRTSRGLAQEKRQASLTKRPTVPLLGRIIAAADGTRLTQRRNVALLWFLMMSGTRISETLALRRGEPTTDAERLRYPGWLDRTSDPVSVVLVRKGGVRQRIALPPYVLGALGTFWDQMASLVPNDVHPDMQEYRYLLLVREPDAPLFPPVGLWGANSAKQDSEHGQWGYRKTMTRQAVQMLLCRLSHKAGLTESERARIHPHGMRHVAAEAMVAEGRPLRDVQAILGHESMKTTEGYLPDRYADVRQSGQNEVLEYFGRKGFWQEATPALPEPARAPEIVRTYGQEKKEKPAAKAARKVRELGPALLPTGPAPPPQLLPPAAAPAPGAALTGLGQSVSPGSPDAGYESLSEGKKPPKLSWSSSPQSRWIAEHYPKVPVGFAIGQDSLLPWWNKDAPTPWPVLAPSQAYPELAPEQGFLMRLERLYDEWARTTPTATLGLAQWLYFLGMLTVSFEDKIAGAYSWVTYEAAASIGDDVRSHDDSWLVAWFSKNAHTFTTAQRRYGGVSKPTPSEGQEEYWERVREDIGVAGLYPGVPSLPEWYFEPDPVHAIYDRSPTEWKAFQKWLLKLTGQERSDLRTESRDEQIDFLERAEESSEARARRFIEEFYSVVNEMRDPARDRSTQEQEQLSQQLEALRKYVRDEWQIDLPRQAAAEDETRVDERINRMLRDAFRPQAEPAETRNVLGDSRMFQPEAFRIDPREHTISHTRSFRESFASEHFGRDSECVMRRIARSLWEKVRGWEAPGAPRRTEPEQQRELFVTLLAQLAYVVPCPPDIESKLVDAGLTYSRPSEIGDYLNQRIVAMYEGGEPEDDLDEVAADIADTIAEQTDPEQYARAVRQRPNTGELIANATRVAPHPLRLVAATFWPV